MSTQRIFPWADFLQPVDGEPVRSVVTQSEYSVFISVVAPVEAGYHVS